MAVKHEILFTIDPNGNISITVEGVKGGDCLKITEELEKAFGIVLDREHTAEYYQEEEERLQITLGDDD
jgi:hypothetical protein